MKKGLGRGLDALFSIYQEDEEIQVQPKKENKKEVVEEKIEISNSPAQKYDAGVVELNLKQVDPNKNQPRKTFEPNALKELAESIKQHGVIQPIIVNLDVDGNYMIIAGERRYRACKLAGLSVIPCIVKNYTEKQIKDLEHRVSRLENMLQPSPLTIPLKTAVYIIAAVGLAYIAADVIYTFIIKT